MSDDTHDWQLVGRDIWVRLRVGWLLQSHLWSLLPRWYACVLACLIFLFIDTRLLHPGGWASVCPFLSSVVLSLAAYKLRSTRQFLSMKNLPFMSNVCCAFIKSHSLYVHG
ncbi:hypothetical protein P280DRAFT_274993 [Massarina eburnea CBS 473.64]|uniref:Uncharacterized protein n=1 Tax=Massarina eburnea CBS 473.64 TaxID=1395130 RepID=A0A6A6S575_9PLEO|nr:hypothetical protein P280DRAFT_274993 [Massarina eburnea CBS 473.64]